MAGLISYSRRLLERGEPAPHLAAPPECLTPEDEILGKSSSVVCFCRHARCARAFREHPVKLK
jgi:hypothetical protein